MTTNEKEEVKFTNRTLIKAMSSPVILLRSKRKDYSACTIVVYDATCVLLNLPYYPTCRIYDSKSWILSKKIKEK